MWHSLTIENSNDIYLSTVVYSEALGSSGTVVYIFLFACVVERVDGAFFHIPEGFRIILNTLGTEMFLT